ncbi:Ubiquitin carboxyl-terminal hydrolase MINDY-1 [Cichlidogyrus casuarinus]|uniref:Ubiquitin carboxyl-terminal hydrolase n=1 Tax=Cichlidogyrus casuarinus TaxID=1844966 RepID=A0ABD2PX63_9PLAT
MDSEKAIDRICPSQNTVKELNSHPGQNTVGNVDKRRVNESPGSSFEKPNPDLIIKTPVSNSANNSNKAQFENTVSDSSPMHDNFSSSQKPIAECSKASTSKLRDTEEPNSIVYSLKWFNFNSHKVPMVMQNSNGPCPIIAISNFLLLKGSLKLPTDSHFVSNEKLCNMLSEKLLEANSSTSSQLTFFGLTALNKHLADGQLAVLFRNNHFSTVTKRNNDIYVLVTDMGFLHEPRVVWEALLAIDGDTQYVDSDFKLFEPHNRTSDIPEVDSSVRLAQKLHQELNSPTYDSDYQLALKLQSEMNQLDAEPKERPIKPKKMQSSQPQEAAAAYPECVSRNEQRRSSEKLLRFCQRRRSDFAAHSVDAIVSSLRAGDRSTLARAITLVESSNSNHKAKSMQLLGKSLELTSSDRYTRTFRIG